MPIKESIIKAKSFLFAIRIVNLCKYVQVEKKEYVLTKQLLRSGTAVGAMIRELNIANHAKILSINLQLLKKKSTKLSIGWSF